MDRAPRPTGRRHPAIGLRLRRHLGLGAAVAVGVLVASPAARADRYVAALATADPAYAAQRHERSTENPETYVILEGRRFPGTTRDRTLERTDIHAVARLLAPALAQQHYRPAAELTAADLLIAIHWGVAPGARQDVEFVQRQSEAMNERQAAGQETRQHLGEADANDQAASDLSAALGHADYDWTIMTAQQANPSELGSTTAALLGFTSTLREEEKTPFGTPEGAQLRAYLEDDRYFVILVAYDFRHLQATAQLKRLWTCRLSVRAAGANFRQAVQRLGQVGGAVVGEHLPAIQVTKAPRLDQPETVVEIGEATVIGTLPPPTAD